MGGVCDTMGFKDEYQANCFIFLKTHYTMTQSNRWYFEHVTRLNRMKKVDLIFKRFSNKAYTPPVQKDEKIKPARVHTLGNCMLANVSLGTMINSDSKDMKFT